MKGKADRFLTPAGFIPQAKVVVVNSVSFLPAVFRSKITFDAHPEFMRRYDLRFKDQQAVREVFHSGVLQLIETEPRTFYIEGAGNDLIVYPADSGYPDGRVRPEELPELLDFGAALGSQFLAGGNAEVVWV